MPRTTFRPVPFRPKPRRSRSSVARSAPYVPLVAMLCGIGLIGSLASPSYAAGKKTNAKGFYVGKTITFVSGSVGGTLDLEARALAPYIGSYLHASVNVEDLPSSGGVQAQDTTASAIPNGLTIGPLNVLGNVQQVLTHTSGINFNPERVAFLAGAGPSGDVVIANPQSPYTSFAALKSARQPVAVLDYLSGSTPALLQTFVGVMGLNVRYITGYSSSGAVVQGFQRGDGPVTITTLSLAGPLLASGKAVALAVTNPFPVGTDYRKYVANAPTFAQLVKRYSPRTALKKKQAATLLDLVKLTGQPIFTQTKVPYDRVKLLRSAIKYALTRPNVKAQLTQYGVNNEYVSPVAAKQLYITTLNTAKVIAQYLVS